MLSKEHNYIVSGLERSGTSMMMQVLYRGGAGIAFDTLREPDEYNPKGYYELEGGKIISRLMEGTFPLEEYKGCFIKITAYGLKFLPEGSYKVIYMLRNINEVVKSTERMSGEKVDKEEKSLLEKLNNRSLQILRNREDIDYITVSYNHAITYPLEIVDKINEFLSGILDRKSAAEAIIPDLRHFRHGSL